MRDSDSKTNRACDELLQSLFFVITLTGFYCRSGASPRFAPGAALLRWLFHVVVLAWFYEKTAEDDKVAPVQDSAQ
jgi:hypothetical protein